MTTHLLKKNSEFWTQDRSLTALLIYLMISIFFILPFAALGYFELVISDVVFSLILISGVFSIAPQKSVKVIMVLLAILTFIVRWIFVVNPSRPIMLAETIFTIIFLTALAILVLLQVFKEGHINFHRIQGAVAVFLLIGLIWANLFQAIHLVDESSFMFIPEITSDNETFFTKFLYFSFVTLTTIGFGDITPVHPLAKSLVMLEGLIGMLFPAIMITRLVGLEIESRKSRATTKS